MATAGGLAQNDLRGEGPAREVLPWMPGRGAHVSYPFLGVLWGANPVSKPVPWRSTRMALRYLLIALASWLIGFLMFAVLAVALPADVARAPRGALPVWARVLGNLVGWPPCRCRLTGVE